MNSSIIFNYLSNSYIILIQTINVGIKAPTEAKKKKKNRFFSRSFLFFSLIFRIFHHFFFQFFDFFHHFGSIHSKFSSFFINKIDFNRRFLSINRFVGRFYYENFICFLQKITKKSPKIVKNH